MILHCYWWEFWSRETDVLIILVIILIKHEILLNLNNTRSKPHFFRLLWYIVVFRLVAYLLNIISVLYQFLEIGTSDRTLIGIDQRLKCCGFSLYPPFIFPLQSLNMIMKNAFLFVESTSIERYQ